MANGAEFSRRSGSASIGSSRCTWRARREMGASERPTHCRSQRNERNSRPRRGWSPRRGVRSVPGSVDTAEPACAATLNFQAIGVVHWKVPDVTAPVTPVRTPHATGPADRTARRAGRVTGSRPAAGPPPETLGDGEPHLRDGRARRTRAAAGQADRDTVRGSDPGWPEPGVTRSRDARRSNRWSIASRTRSDSATSRSRNRRTFRSRSASSRTFTAWCSHCKDSMSLRLVTASTMGVDAQASTARRSGVTLVSDPSLRT